MLRLRGGCSSTEGPRSTPLKFLIDRSSRMLAGQIRRNRISGEWAAFVSVVTRRITTGCTIRPRSLDRRITELLNLDFHFSIYSSISLAAGLRNARAATAHADRASPRANSSAGLFAFQRSTLIDRAAVDRILYSAASRPGRRSVLDRISRRWVLVMRAQEARLARHRRARADIPRGKPGSCPGRE